MEQPNTSPTGTVTFLFTDIEGSTRRWEQARPAMAAALARHDALLWQAIEAHDGHVFKTIGDAFCAAFADAGAALRAALAGQRALATEPWDESTGPLRVRMALHAGEAEERAADYFGPAVNRVARLLSTGSGGQVLLSRAAADRVRGRLPAGCSLLDLGSHRLKDLVRPEHVFQLVAPGSQAEFPPLKSLEARPNNLPAQPTPLVGREREVAAATGLLRHDDVRLLILTGPGGTGKTRLGLQIAAELVEAFPDGVWFVDLSGLQEPGQVIPHVARVVGVREEGGQPLGERLAEALRGERILLMLDNFEQVVAAASEVAALLTVCPKLKVLVTSRATLRLRGERELRVPPLAVPDPNRPPPLAELAEFGAVRLFAERAAAANPSFALTAENARDVIAVCTRLEGLPLAIELAAVRIRLLAPTALLARLEQRLPQLARGSRDLPERQQTMRGAIAWSYDLLPPDQQALFRRLAVFAGGWMLDAAEDVASAAGDLGSDVLAGLEELTDQSLVRLLEEPNGEPRFAMLEMLREFGLEQLTANCEEAATRRAHAAHFLALAEQAEPALTGAAQREWLARLEGEHDNFRSGLTWSADAAAETNLRLAVALGQFWWVRGHLTEGRAWLERALRCTAEAPAAMRATAMRRAGVLARSQGDYRRAAELYEESLALCRALGDTRGVGILLNNLGLVASDQDDPARAAALFEESLALCRALGDTHGVATSLLNLGNVAEGQGDYRRAAVLYEESLALFRALGDTRMSAVALANLGDAAHGEDDYGRAAALYEESLALFRALGAKRAIATWLTNFGLVARDQGDHGRAAALYEESLVLGQELGDKRCIAACLEGIADAAIAQGQPERAARIYGAAASLRAELGLSPDPASREESGGAVEEVRASLGGTAFTAAWDGGLTLSLEEAVAEALALADELVRATREPITPQAIEQG